MMFVNLKTGYKIISREYMNEGCSDTGTEGNQSGCQTGATLNPLKELFGTVLFVTGL